MDILTEISKKNKIKTRKLRIFRYMGCNDMDFSLLSDILSHPSIDKYDKFRLSVTCLPPAGSGIKA